MKIFNLIKKLIHRRNPSDQADTSYFMRHGYREFEFQSHFLASLMNRIGGNLNIISNQKSKGDFVNHAVDYSKRLSLLNRIFLKILVRKIREMEKVKGIVAANDLISIEINSTLDSRKDFKSIFLRVNHHSVSEELHLIIPVRLSNSEISSTCFNFISRQFCDDGCILVDSSLEKYSKLMALHYPDMDFISNLAQTNFVPTQYRLSLSSNYHGAVFFDPKKTYHSLFNLSSEKDEIFYIKFKFRMINFNDLRLRRLSDECNNMRSKVYLGGINIS